MASPPERIVVTKHGKRVERPTTPEERAWYAANIQRHAEDMAKKEKRDAEERALKAKRDAILSDLSDAEKADVAALADRVQRLIEMMR